MFKERLDKANQTNQGADNPYYNNVNHKRLMWMQQFIEKQRNFSLIYIGAYILCSFIFLTIFSYLENFKIKNEDGYSFSSHIDYLGTLSNHSIIFIIILPIIGFILYFYFRYKVKVAYGNLNVGQKGTARWTTKEEIKEQYKAIPLKIEEFSGMGGIPIARDKDTFYIDDSNTNNLVIGTTRSGKGEAIVNPMSENLSRGSEKCSMILTDPKLELAFMQIPELTKRGYDCYIINLIDLEYSACYNPLKLIIDEYEFEIENKNNDTSNSQQMCESVAYSLFPDNPNDPQPFFSIGSRDLFIAGVYACMEDAYKADKKENELKKIFYEEEIKEKEIEWAKSRYKDDYKRYFLCKAIDELCETEPTIIEEPASLLYILGMNKEELGLDQNVEKPSMNSIKDILEFYNTIYKEKSGDENINQYKKPKFIKTRRNAKKVTIGSVINLIVELNHKEMLDSYFQNREEGNYAKIKYATVGSAGTKAKGDLISTFFTKVSTFIPTNIQRLTSKNSFEITDIGFGEKPVAIFIGLPDYDQSKNFIASLFLDQVYMTLSKLSSAMPDKKVPRRVHFILDEFGNLPALNDMGARIKLGLGRNLIYTLIVQDLSSIHDIYKEEATAIISNCGNKIYLKAGDNETNEDFSKLLGSETYTNINRSGKFLSLNKERTEIIEERPLITAEELGKLKMGEMIVHRIMKRTDNNGKPITVYPIANIGENRMPYRYEYMPEVFNDKQILYESVNIIRIRNRYGDTGVNDYLVKGKYVNKIDTINLKSITLNLNDYLSWQQKKDKFINFNEENEEHIHSFIMSLPKEYLSKDEKRLLQNFDKSGITEAEKERIYNELMKIPENKIVRYKDVEKICNQQFIRPTWENKTPVYFAKIYVELHKEKYRLFFINYVSKKLEDDSEVEESKLNEEYYNEE